MQVLLTETAGRLLDERADRVDPAVEQVRMNREGRLTVDGRQVDAGSVRPEVAFATGDMFFRGGAAPWFELLLSLESLRWFQSPAAGYIALYDRLFERGVRVTGAHVNAIPIAEYVIQAVLAHFQRAQEWAAARTAHEWRPHEFREVYGTTWLVIGVGSIGSAVAERARALGARVLGHRRRPTGHEPVDEMLPREALLDELPRCDVVVLAAPATPETTGFVDDRLLAAMAPDSVLVNVAPRRAPRRGRAPGRARPGPARGRDPRRVRDRAAARRQPVLGASPRGAHAALLGRRARSARPRRRLVRREPRALSQRAVARARRPSRYRRGHEHVAR